MAKERRRRNESLSNRKQVWKSRRKDQLRRNKISVHRKESGFCRPITITAKFVDRRWVNVNDGNDDNDDNDDNDVYVGNDVDVDNDDDFNTAQNSRKYLWNAGLAKKAYQVNEHRWSGVNWNWQCLLDALITQLLWQDILDVSLLFFNLFQKVIF